MIRVPNAEGFVACDEAIATHYYVLPTRSVEEIDLEWCDRAVEGLELSPELQSALEKFAQNEQLEDDLDEDRAYVFWAAWGEYVPGITSLGDAIRKAAPRLTREIPAERIYLRCDMIVTPTETGDNARSWGLGD